jgi:hypothetical protein
MKPLWKKQRQMFPTLWGREMDHAWRTAQRLGKERQLLTQRVFQLLREEEKLKRVFGQRTKSDESMTRIATILECSVPVTPRKVAQQARRAREHETTAKYLLTQQPTLGQARLRALIAIPDDDDQASPATGRLDWQDVISKW